MASYSRSAESDMLRLHRAADAAQPKSSEQRSRIKPHLIHLSGSGSALDSIVIERDRERAKIEYDPVPPKNPKHVIVLYAGDSAELEYKMNGRSRVSQYFKDDLILNPAGFFAAPRWHKDSELILAAIDSARLNYIAEEIGCRRLELPPRFQFRDELLKYLLSALINEFEQNSPADRVYADYLSHALMAHLLKKYSGAKLEPFRATNGLPRHTFNHVANYIHANLKEPLSLETIAKEAGISASHFALLFKQSAGVTLHRYVAIQRIRTAETILTTSKTSIAEVAIATGFADQSHLTRVMRKYTGKTPAAVRKNSLASR